MVHNSYQPVMEVDPQSYEVRADGVLLTCEPAEVLPLAQRYFCFNTLLAAPMKSSVQPTQLRVSAYTHHLN